MINLAGVTEKIADSTTFSELKEAKIDLIISDSFSNYEVKTKNRGILNGWIFRRAWYYWIAETKTNPISFKVAEKLHEEYGKEIRVAGYAGGISPKEWYSDEYRNGVFHYHIDTQKGLNKLAEVIKKGWSQKKRNSEMLGDENE